mmetsp:Transcript_55091/g.96461  ORF Transcript_55091/g.96461 Transcript_55091/m.96461 type:complete len:391 (-) Transcript_55091:127-1299(-)|eukprot:CAMPEP_0184971424 /NCGR_PEP_ID=MMETSP1098-20130426/3651_1 /TAXON_ID=89044 /ORGANISM="Spumella elongata, Strain CCAP 955/1" /LENGTH=390 /DNA_ID=CAMNT_0027493541 /DNA_START=1242 /DNA_END=2414 /DNA_ORIENTATION=-
MSFPLYQGHKISRISVYQVDLPLHESSYKWSGGKSVTTFDATVVKIETDTGFVGYGENTPLGPFYLPAYAEGTRAGINMLAPSLIGIDATRLNQLNVHMDRTLKGHPYVKSAIDMACWDILGKVSGLPVCELLGGRFNDSFKLYRAISQDTPEGMARNVEKYVNEGYRIFQLKVGGAASDDIERIHAVRAILDAKTKELRAAGEIDLHMPLLCDANTGWKMHDAVRVVNGVRDLDVYIEQPCLSYEECVSVRRMCTLPFVIDESMDDIGMLTRIIADKSADLINLKISKVGGLTKARAVRDLAVSAGIAMNIEDTWGGDIVTAAIAALAHSTPPDFLFCSTDFNSYGPVSIAETTAQRCNGRLAAPIEPGLGVTPRPEVLGEPVFVYPPV